MENPYVVRPMVENRSHLKWTRASFINMDKFHNVSLGVMSKLQENTPVQLHRFHQVKKKHRVITFKKDTHKTDNSGYLWVAGKDYGPWSREINFTVIYVFQQECIHVLCSR